MSMTILPFKSPIIYLWCLLKGIISEGAYSLSTTKTAAVRSSCHRTYLAASRISTPRSPCGLFFSLLNARFLSFFFWPSFFHDNSGCTLMRRPSTLTGHHRSHIAHVQEAVLSNLDTSLCIYGSYTSAQTTLQLH